MKFSVKFPSRLRDLLGELEYTFEVPDKYEILFRDALEISIKNFLGKEADFRERFYDREGKLRRTLNFFVGEEDIRFMGELNTKVKDGQEILIIPAIAGG